MKFRKYQHIERLGTGSVEGILDGQCTIFYKIDGTNSSCWLDENGNLKAGSRKRELTLKKDNQGFYAHALSNKNIFEYLQAHPTHRLYGEWLVKHTLKTYEEGAWHKFYIFDVVKDLDDGNIEYLPYDLY